MRRLFVLTCVLVGCGGGGGVPQDATSSDGSHVPPSDGGVDAPGDATPDAPPFTPVPPPSNPLPVENNGGPVIAAPNIVFLSYASDANGSAIASFLTWLPTSTYFTSSLAQYGISAGTFAGSYTFGSTAPTTYPLAQLKTDLDTRIANGDFGAATTSTVYVLLVPPNVQINDDLGGTTCQDFWGFHTFTPAGHPVALTFTCPGNTVDDLTTTTSHEVAEMVTDPERQIETGWYFLYAKIIGGELADMCEGVDIVQDGYMVERVFSNTAASAGQDPCEPADSTTGYVGVAPTDTVQPAAAAGSTVTTHWKAFATQRPTGPMKFFVFANPDLQVSVAPCAGSIPSGCTVHPGDTFTIDITVKPDTLPGYKDVVVYTADGTRLSAQWNMRVGTAPTACNALTQDCSVGEGCQRWWNDLSHAALGGCVAAGSGTQGSACSGNNDCAPGYECVGGGTCVAYCGVCDPSNLNDPCSYASTYQASSTYCDPHGASPTFCTKVFNEPDLNGNLHPTQVVCAPGCDIYNPSSCTDIFGQPGACYYEYAGLACESFHGNAPAGSACSYDNSCAPGDTCWAGKCATTCHVGTANACANGARCLDVGDVNVPGLGLCDPPCDIFTPSCTDVFGNAGACYDGASGPECDSAGTIPLGGACNYINDCAPGSNCLGGGTTFNCYQNCHVGTANACPGGQTCYDLGDPNAPGLGACD